MNLHDERRIVSDDELFGSDTSNSLGGNYKGEHTILSFEVEASVRDGEPMLDKDGNPTFRLKANLMSRKGNTFSQYYSGYPQPGKTLNKFSTVGQFYNEMRNHVIDHTRHDDAGNPIIGRPLYSAGVDGDSHSKLVADMNASWVGLVVKFEEFGGKPVEKEDTNTGKSVTIEFPTWHPRFGDRTLDDRDLRFTRPMDITRVLSDEELEALYAEDEPEVEEAGGDEEVIVNTLLTLMAGKTREKVLEQAALIDTFEDIDLDTVIDNLIEDQTVTVTKSGVFKVLQEVGS